jgi:hypothetical protein
VPKRCLLVFDVAATAVVAVVVVSSCQVKPSANRASAINQSDSAGVAREPRGLSNSATIRRFWRVAQFARC